MKKQIWLGVFLLLFSNPSSSTATRIINPVVQYLGKKNIQTIGITWGSSSPQVIPEPVTLQYPASDNKYTSFLMNQGYDSSSTQGYATAIHNTITAELDALSSIEKKKRNKIASAAKTFVDKFKPKNDDWLGFFAVIFYDKEDIGIYAMWIHNPFWFEPDVEDTLSLGVKATHTFLKTAEETYEAKIKFTDLKK